MICELTCRHVNHSLKFLKHPIEEGRSDKNISSDLRLDSRVHHLLLDFAISDGPDPQSSLKLYDVLDSIVLDLCEFID